MPSFLSFLLLITSTLNIICQALTCPKDSDCGPCVSGSSCTLNCIGKNYCKGGHKLTCQSDVSCILNCQGPNACTDSKLIPNGATSVTVICTGGDACSGSAQITCEEDRPCDITCNAGNCHSLDLDVNGASDFICHGNGNNDDCPSSAPQPYAASTPYPTTNAPTTKAPTSNLTAKVPITKVTTIKSPITTTPITKDHKQREDTNVSNEQYIINPLYYIISILIIGGCGITVLLLFGLYLHHKRVKKMVTIIEKHKSIDIIQSKSQNFTHSEVNQYTLHPMPSPITANPTHSYSIKLNDEIPSPITTNQMYSHSNAAISSPSSQINFETYMTPISHQNEYKLNNNHTQIVTEGDDEIDDDVEGLYNNNGETEEILQHIILSSNKSNRKPLPATPSTVCLPGESGIKSNGRPTTPCYHGNQVNQSQIAPSPPFKPMTPWDIMSTANSCSLELKNKPSSLSSLSSVDSNNNNNMQSLNSNACSLPSAFYAHCNAMTAQQPHKLELLHIVDSMDGPKKEEDRKITYNAYDMEEMSEISDVTSSDTNATVVIHDEVCVDNVEIKEEGVCDNDNHNVSNSSSSELSISFSITSTKTGNNETQKVLNVVHDTECKLMGDIQFKDEKDRKSKEIVMNLEGNSSITIMSDNSDNTPEPNEYDSRRDKNNTNHDINNDNDDGFIGPITKL